MKFFRSFAKIFSRDARKLWVGISGGAVLLVGIVAIPYPGPGWLIVFAGLGILATEFEWAQSVLDVLKKKYDAWQAWVKRQHISIKLITFLFTTLVVVLTVWVVNGYGIIDEVLKLHQPWLHSPIFR